MDIPKQDRNGVRTAPELERRYKPAKTEKRVEQLEEDTTLDIELSQTSNKGVQNKVIAEAIEKLNNQKVNYKDLEEITEEEIDKLFEEGGTDG